MAAGMYSRGVIKVEGFCQQVLHSSVTFVIILPMPHILACIIRETLLWPKRLELLSELAEMPTS